MRRLATCLLLLALPACGQVRDLREGDPEPTPPAVMTAERAHDIARVSVLRPEDLPGYKLVEDDPAADDADPEVAGSECQEGFKPLGSDSLALVRGTTHVVSQVYVAADREAVKQQLDFFRGPKFAPCVEKALTAGMTAAGAKVGKVTTKRFKVEVRDTVGTFGYAMTMTATREGKEVPFTAHVAGSGRGHAAVLVLTVSGGKAEFAPPGIAALVFKVTERAAAKEASV